MGAPRELSAEAAEFSSVNGRLNCLAELVMSVKETALSSIATQRDRTDASRECRGLIVAFREEMAQVDADDRIVELEHRLSEVQTAMEGMSGGVVREDHAPPFSVPESSTPH